MERTGTVTQVKAFKTRSGNTRFVLTDDQGNEYTTFKEDIARKAVVAEGHRARIEYHETERGGYQNVYLDDVEVLDADDEEVAHDRDADEVAWKTAVEATPWLLGDTPSRRGVEAEELFAKLKPFKDLVADDIEDGEDLDHA
jgi:hypothetical protein